MPQQRTVHQRCRPVRAALARPPAPGQRSSAGPSGWTGELVRDIVGDPDCLNSLCVLITAICNGGLPDAVRDRLTASRLVPAPKSKGGVRPIAVGESFMRLAALHALYVTTIAKIGDEFADVQAGTAANGGAETAVHAIQSAIDAMPAADCGIVLSTDFKNAFNTRHRRAIAEALFAAPGLSPLWRFFHWAYKAPSPLLVYGRDGVLYGTIESQEGVRQGDPLSSILYDLSVQQLYVSTGHHARRTTNSRYTAVAVHDDYTGVGTPAAVFAAYPTSPSRVHKNLLPHTMRAIIQREMEKTNKYSPLASQYAATFIPFVCDVYGALGDGAHRLIRWIVAEASASGRLSDSAERRQFRTMAYASLSVAIQRATAICAVTGSMNIRGGGAVQPR